jgi:2-keto-3-deoxy-L-rhamnonate aldolase RhmA
MGDRNDRLVNPVREKLRAGDVALGMTVRISRTPDIARIAKSTGHDFIFIDGQHSAFDLETTVAICHAALAISVASLVRVRGADDPNAAIFLDNGAAGIIYPNIATASDAQKAVDQCKFPPLGKRSVAGGYPHFGYRSMSLSDCMHQLNEFCLLVCMIETAEGLNNVESIAAVKGVDVIHLGCNDLLASIGKAGNFDDPEILAAQERVIKAARDNAIFAGCGGNRDVERQARAIRCGARFVTTQTDVGFLAASAGQWVDAVRAATAK